MKHRIKKTFVKWAAVGLISACTAMTAMAGQWIPNGTQWSYLNDNGQYSAGAWQWIDKKCYYFDANGVMLANTVTPDQCTVDASGAWTVDGVIQIQDPVAGWNQAGSTWHYYSGGRPRAASWLKVGGERYYFAPNGVMVTGLQNIDGEDYYFEANGALRTRSFTLDGDRYEVESDGVIVDIIDEEDWFFDDDDSSSSHHYTSSGGGSGSGGSGGGSSLESQVDEEDYARAVFDIVNEERAAKGRSELTWNDKVADCAQVRAEELLESFSHTRPDGQSCFSIFSEEGMSYSTCGENIAMGQPTPTAVMEAWMNSTGHRKNILNGSFEEMGVGCVVQNGYCYWVQLFYTE